MRFVIFGAGAIGGVVGARLHQSGHEVALIARGAHLEAIRRSGLTLQTPVERTVLPITAVQDPSELGLGSDDVVLLATKSQDTAGALSALKRAGAEETPIACLQNGVDNERAALRLFGEVYGAVVMAPTAHLEPGIVLSYGTRETGIIDIGRYPSGTDERCQAIADALSESRISSRVQSEIMRAKYAKLLVNLGNVVEALSGRHSDEARELVAQAGAEGTAVLTAAGIPFEADDVSDVHGRWERMGVDEIAGRPRAGSSSWQSLARGTGAIETDYLNGEIVLLGRLHGVPTPVNAALCAVAGRYARQGRRPGELNADGLLGVAAA
jgi:2-dehydropantoate 2-reductase